MPVTVDLTPPTLEVVAATRYVRPGGAGVVVVRTADAVRAEARVGTLAFPTFPVSGAEAGTRTALFALPHDVAHGTPLSVVAAASWIRDHVTTPLELAGLVHAPGSGTRGRRP